MTEFDCGTCLRPVAMSIATEYAEKHRLSSVRLRDLVDNRWHIFQSAMNAEFIETLVFV